MKLFLLSVLAAVIIPSHGRFNTLEAIKVRSAITLPGKVLSNENALKLLQRQAEIVYQTNLPQYLDELRQINPDIKPDFTDQSFTVVGSLATLDAAIALAEGVENVNFARRDTAAGFSSQPNPTNDKVHTGVQRLNAARNIIWLLKEKLKNGAVSADASLLDKLKEAQTWLSTQTGGHLGQGMIFALKKSGVISTLEAKWGPTSVKFKSFNAGISNGLDFLINSYNTVVNSMAVNQELSTSNILALSSSVTAIAGDVTMGIAEVLSTSAKLSGAAGPIGYAVGATLYIASYATGVASGLTSQEDLEPKDYVKAFLGPLIPDPAFGAIVDVFDQIAKGNLIEAYNIFLTKSFPAALYVGGMAVIDRLTGTTKLEEYFGGIRGLALFGYIRRIQKFEEKLKRNMASVVRKLKPKQLLYTFPHSKKRDHYVVDGWKSASSVKREFGITSELTNTQVFVATYNNNFAKPLACPDKAKQGFSFCPEVAPHGDDKLIFMGNTNVNEKVELDDNCEAYGMGGNDHFVLKAAVVIKGVKINGGDGSDTIDITNTLFGSRSSVSGGGPERDTIKAGPGDDTILVNNDEVKITNGDNTLIVEGRGNDIIQVGTGADLVLIEKSGGSIDLQRVVGTNSNPSQNKPKRIVYQGHARARDAINHDLISGGPTQFDILFMRKYKPQDLERILLIEAGEDIHQYVKVMRDLDIKRTLFEGHDSEVTPRSGSMITKAQKIEVKDIERFEMSESTINMLLLPLRREGSQYYEVTGGPTHDFVINLNPKKPLLAQLSTGDNRVLSGYGKDSYSLILDAGTDIIYDKGGENILAVLIPEGSSMNDVQIGRSRNGKGYKIEGKSRVKIRTNVFENIFHRVEFMFYGSRVDDNVDSVQIIVQDSTGKQITFTPVPPTSAAEDKFSQDRSIGYYYDTFEYCPGDQAVISIVEGIAPSIGETLPRPRC